MADASYLADAKGAQHRAVKALRERDAAVVAAREAGYSLREIAAAVGISHEGVRRIVNRS